MNISSECWGQGAAALGMWLISTGVKVHPDVEWEEVCPALAYSYLVPEHGAKQMLPHSLQVKLPHCIFSTELGEGRMTTGTLCSM